MWSPKIAKDKQATPEKIENVSVYPKLTKVTRNTSKTHQKLKGNVLSETKSNAGK